MTKDTEWLIIFHDIITVWLLWVKCKLKLSQPARHSQKSAIWIVKQHMLYYTDQA